MSRESTSEGKLLALPPALATPSNLNDLDLRLLRVFCAVVDAGGFSAAQSDLNIGQSTISTHMGELEARLGVRLCRRGRSGFALTEYGEAVYEACESLFAALEDFRSRVGEVQKLLVGSLNIGMLDNTITDPNNRLPEAIASFKKYGPHVQINFVVASPSEIGHSITDHRLHIAIATAHHRQPGLIYEEIYQERQFLYCGRGHPLFERAPFDLSPEDMAASEFVSRGYEEERQVIQRRVKAHSTALAYHLEGIVSMILSGHYIGVMPMHYAKYWVDQDLVRPMRPDVLQNDVPFFLVTKRQTRPVAPLNAFRSELAKVFGLTADFGRAPADSDA